MRFRPPRAESGPGGSPFPLVKATPPLAVPAKTMFLSGTSRLKPIRGRSGAGQVPPYAIVAISARPSACAGPRNPRSRCLDAVAAAIVSEGLRMAQVAPGAAWTGDTVRLK